jgi:hypothetical protein
MSSRCGGDEITIYEIYDRNIKSLSIADRLRLARLILDDAAPDEPMTPVEAQARYAEIVRE